MRKRSKKKISGDSMGEISNLRRRKTKPIRKNAREGKGSNYLKVSAKKD